jgi:hypothetical protein
VARDHASPSAIPAPGHFGAPTDLITQAKENALTTPDMTTPAGERPPNDAQAAAAAAQEATDSTALFRDVAQRAATIRAEHDYDGALSTQMVVALTGVLHEPTPARYVKHIPATTGKPYESTGLNSAQFQIDMMNAGYGRAHWRALRHYPAGRHGFICKVVVVVGNNLVAAGLDDAGELVAGAAEILAISEEWGSVKNASSPADSYKGSATNAIKRALAAFGPGSDVFRLEFEDENVGGIGNLHAPDATHQDAHDAGAARQPTVASARQQKLLRARAAEAGLDDAQLANVILWAAQQPQRQFDSLPHASEYLGRLLAALPASLVDPVLRAIQSIQQQARACASAPDARGVPYVGAGDTPGDVAPIEPVAVPSSNGAGPAARAA